MPRKCDVPEPQNVCLQSRMVFLNAENQYVPKKKKIYIFCFKHIRKVVRSCEDVKTSINNSVTQHMEGDCTFSLSLASLATVEPYKNKRDSRVII